MRRELLLIRHRETAMAGTFCGHSDPELNARGRAQAAEVAERLRGERIVVVVASDLRRTRETAEILACEQGAEVVCHQELREISFGAWEGLRWSEIEANDPEYAARWLADFPTLPAPGGEPIEEFEERVLRVVESLVETEMRHFAIVSHGGVMRALMRQLGGSSQDACWEQTREYCAVVRFPILDGFKLPRASQADFVDDEGKTRETRR